jgi:ubiquinol-cytochrome c reductase iron-sulfur subunit
MRASDARRLYLRVTLKFMGAGLLLFVLYVMVSGLFGDPGGDSVLPMHIDLAGLPAGSLHRLEWRGRELMVLRRSPAMDAADAAHEHLLYDPASRWSVQPRDARNPGRTLVPGYFIAYAHGTDLSCPLDLVSPDEAAVEGWGGGFVDRCRGSRYDFAGRVHDGQPARRNLEVPAYRIDGTRIVLER